MYSCIGYAEAKIWLDKSDPKWIDEKDKYDLIRYRKRKRFSISLHHHPFYIFITNKCK